MVWVEVCWVSVEVCGVSVVPDGVCQGSGAPGGVSDIRGGATGMSGDSGIGLWLSLSLGGALAVVMVWVEVCWVSVEVCGVSVVSTCSLRGPVDIGSACCLSLGIS